jgi:hypothetical protein
MIDSNELFNPNRFQMCACLARRHDLDFLCVQVRSCTPRPLSAKYCYRPFAVDDIDTLRERAVPGMAFLCRSLTLMVPFILVFAPCFLIYTTLQPSVTICNYI